MVVLTAGLILFLNATTIGSVSSSEMITFNVPSSLFVAGKVEPLQRETDYSSSSEDLVIGSADSQEEVTVVVPASKVRGVQRNVFHQLRFYSLIGFGMMVVIGSVGSFWLAGRALKPVSDLARAASEVDAHSLRDRLNTGTVDATDDEVRQLAVSFDKMLGRLDGAFEQQGRFVADVAHELRTPLATMRANLEIIGDNPNGTPQDHHEVTFVLEDTIFRMQQLVEDLLLLTCEDGRVSQRPVVLETLTEEVLLELEPQAREQSVKLSMTSEAGDEGAVALGDAALLTHVFQNLLENAICYNKEDGGVAVRIFREDEWIGVSIADTGIGISPDHLPHIFERFYRVDRSRSRRSGGCGLGLSIAEHIVQLHGGRIEAQSSPGMGSTFTVRLRRHYGGSSLSATLS
ncbi:MAG: HAMP domain-containing sensor histidine kinase [Candidatus Bathyarchaeota archaeon]|nr:HAMP domain-containing sensor histidine kinase [Candidatus Bathyarchaeota archaeon]